MPPKPSYRRNRDYSTHFNWTYDLKRDVYQCYLTAKEDPRIRYMKRMKEKWDEIHPEYSFLTDKNLRDQALRIEKNKDVMDTEYVHNRSNNSSQVNEPTDYRNSCFETANNSNNVSYEESQPHLEPLTITQQECFQTMKPLFERNYETMNRQSITERTFITKIIKHPSDDVLKVIDRLAKRKLSQIENPNYLDINVLLYTAAVTTKEYLNDVSKRYTEKTPKAKMPQWITNIEDKIIRIRRTIGHLTTIISCKRTGIFTNHQKKLKEKYYKKYGNTKLHTLNFKLTVLKHNLHATSVRLKYQKKRFNRKFINRKFSTNPKAVYRDFKGNNIAAEKLPTKESIETFWKGIWQEKTTFNHNAKWLQRLENTYCSHVTRKNYDISLPLVNQIISKMNLQKSPGSDLINSFWYKRLSFYREKLTEIYQHTYRGNLVLPSWLTLARTSLLPKNTETELAKNYRPIACLNFMYKIYTSCLNSFLYDRCHCHKIITTEQAAGKKGVWGCTEQLLINKSIMSEVRNKKRNLTTIWLDYKKAFDSVPHEWLIKPLHLAKLPEDLIRAIENLTSQWCTVLQLKGEEEVIESDIIYFSKGIFQGDSLSVLLFILSVNPLSFLLHKLQGYACGKHKNYNATHNFFVDDLKLYASSINTAKKQLDLVTAFSKDTGMTFGDDKCAYQQIQNGKLLHYTKNLGRNQLSIKPMKEGDTYKYLGIDENISYIGPINKHRITREYYHRIKKIWNSQLSSFNKIIAHNTFAVPVFITSVGIVDWTIDEIREVDCKTRKQLAMTGNFHPNGDVDRLYIPRSQGGRGLKSIVRMYESRIVSVAQHLELNKSHNITLQFVVEQEQNDIVRLKEKLLRNYEIEWEDNTTPNNLSKVFIKADIGSQRKRCNAKVMHGYYEKKLEQDPGIDRSLSFL